MKGHAADLHLQRLTQMPAILRRGLVALALTAALAVALWGLIYSSPYAPLLVGGAAAASTVIIAWVRKPVWALYAAVLVVFLPAGLIPAQIQSSLNRSVTVIALAAWLVDVLSRQRRVVLLSSTWLMLGFVAWSSITLLWAQNLERGVIVLLTYTLRLLLFLLLPSNEIDNQEHLGGLMSTLALNGWVLLLTGVYAVWQQGYAAGTRLQVLGQNENDIGVLAVVALAGVLWQVLKPGRGRRVLSRLLAVVFLFLALGLTAMSGSRGSAISFVVALLVLCLWKRTRPWGRLGLLILALGAIVAPFMLSTTIQRFISHEGDTLLGGREVLWQAGWMLIRDHPFQGIGIGNAADAVVPYVRLFRSVGNADSIALHNPVLTVWAETGIPGIALYLAALGAAVTSFLQRWRASRWTTGGLLEPYLAIVSAVFAGYMCSWIKGGGVETDFSYFLMVALLLIPSCLPLQPDMHSRLSDERRVRA